MLYGFRYTVPGRPPTIRETRELTNDTQARACAIRELLHEQRRLGVEVWRDDRMIYARRRGPKTPS